jgi:hypothetical protein
MNSNNGKKLVFLTMMMALWSCQFGGAEVPGTPIADYRTGALINIPSFITQPYFSVAQSGCPIVDRPVCGVNGKTYQNECFLKLAIVEKAYEGWCIGQSPKNDPNPPQSFDPFSETEETGFLRYGTPTTGSCPCNDTYYPVCGDKGVTYANLCRAKCNGTFAVQVGPCYNFYYRPQKNLTCKCTYSQEKVCATDGSNYENSCVMACANAIFKSIEICETPCKCPFYYKPVCGIDGRNYINECELNCKNVQKAFTGRCETRPMQQCTHCLGDISKVCGNDDKTYDNICYSKCHHVDIAYQGACIPPKPDGACVCPKIYLPVCSFGNKTFDNECLARCANKKVKSVGACPRRVPHHRHRGKNHKSNFPRLYTKPERKSEHRDKSSKKSSRSDKWDVRPIKVVYRPRSRKDHKSYLVGSSN